MRRLGALDGGYSLARCQLVGLALQCGGLFVQLALGLGLLGSNSLVFKTLGFDGFTFFCGRLQLAQAGERGLLRGFVLWREFLSLGAELHGFDVCDALLDAFSWQAFSGGHIAIDLVDHGEVQCLAEGIALSLALLLCGLAFFLGINLLVDAVLNRLCDGDQALNLWSHVFLERIYLGF